MCLSKTLVLDFLDTRLDLKGKRKTASNAMMRLISIITAPKGVAWWPMKWARITRLDKIHKVVSSDLPKSWWLELPGTCAGGNRYPVELVEMHASWLRHHGYQKKC